MLTRFCHAQTNAFISFFIILHHSILLKKNTKSLKLLISITKQSMSIISIHWSLLNSWSDFTHHSHLSQCEWFSIIIPQKNFFYLSHHLTRFKPLFKATKLKYSDAVKSDVRYFGKRNILISWFSAFTYDSIFFNLTVNKSLKLLRVTTMNWR